MAAACLATTQRTHNEVVNLDGDVVVINEELTCGSTGEQSGEILNLTLLLQT